MYNIASMKETGILHVIEATGMNRTQLAAHLGRTEAYIYQLISDPHRLTIRILRKLAQAADMTPEDAVKIILRDEPHLSSSPTATTTL